MECVGARHSGTMAQPGLLVHTPQPGVETAAGRAAPGLDGQCPDAAVGGPIRPPRRNSRPGMAPSVAGVNRDFATGLGLV